MNSGSEKKMNVLNIPSGSLRTSALLNNDVMNSNPSALIIDGTLSEAILGVPVSVSGNITSYSFQFDQTITQFSFSFDREAFINALKAKLQNAEKVKYKSVFDSLHRIESNFKKYDSIRTIINSNQYLVDVSDARQMINRMNSDQALVSAGLNPDSAELNVFHDRIDEDQKLQEAYLELLRYRETVADQFHTVDLQEITQQLPLPVNPDALNEEEIISRAKAYGLSPLENGLAGLKELTIGQSVVHQSPLTVSQKLVNGFTFRYAAGPFYTGGILGRERLNGPPLQSGGSAYVPFNFSKQFNVVTQGLAGAGDPQKEFVQVSVTHFGFSDQASDPAMNTITGYNNTLFSASTGMHDVKGFGGSAEVTGSSNYYELPGVPDG